MAEKKKSYRFWSPEAQFFLMCKILARRVGELVLSDVSVQNRASRGPRKKYICIFEIRRTQKRVKKQGLHTKWRVLKPFWGILGHFGPFFSRFPTNWAACPDIYAFSGHV